MDDSVFVTLSAPLEYSVGSETETTDQVEIRCPSFLDEKARRYYAHLRGIMAQYSLVMESDDATDNSIPAGEMLLAIIAGLGDSFYDELEKFLQYSERCCFLDGDTPMKSGSAMRMHPDDQAKIFGHYVANFILPSLFLLISGKD